MNRIKKNANELFHVRRSSLIFNNYFLAADILVILYVRDLRTVCGCAFIILQIIKLFAAY